MAGSAASPDTMIPHGDLVKLIVEKHDPTVIATHSTEQVQAEQDKHLEIKVTPQPLPGWAAAAGRGGPLRRPPCALGSAPAPVRTAVG
jgi:hypothetical protein